MSVWALYTHIQTLFIHTVLYTKYKISPLRLQHHILLLLLTWFPCKYELRSCFMTNWASWYLGSEYARLSSGIQGLPTSPVWQGICVKFHGCLSSLYDVWKQTTAIFSLSCHNKMESSGWGCTYTSPPTLFMLWTNSDGKIPTHSTQLSRTHQSLLLSSL